MRKLLKLLKFSTKEQEILNNVKDGLTDEERQDFSVLLTDPLSYESAEKRLIARLSPDPDGLKMLSVMLFAAKTSYKKYNEIGIDEDIFIETFKCFKRFTSEYKNQYGRFGFDRSFWVGRQLSLRLFRIGELEYELSHSANGEREVALHVPSDCDISLDKIDISIDCAKSFIDNFYPEYNGVPYYITSWMLSPILKEVLKPDSRILAFQRLFDVISETPSDEYKFWVFGSEKIKPEDFAEKTSLQRGIKRLVLSGRTMTEATAKLNSHYIIAEILSKKT